MLESREKATLYSYDISLTGLREVESVMKENSRSDNVPEFEEEDEIMEESQVINHQDFSDDEE